MFQCLCINLQGVVLGLSEQRYKCQICYHILKDEDLIEGNCPECMQKVEKMCDVDHCNCHHEMSEILAYCPKCGEACCPEIVTDDDGNQHICGCHDVMQLSRITGYLQEVGGWNKAKAQELKDRTHYNFDGSIDSQQMTLN